MNLHSSRCLLRIYSPISTRISARLEAKMDSCYLAVPCKPVLDVGNHYNTGLPVQCRSMLLNSYYSVWVTHMLVIDVSSISRLSD